MNQNKTFSDTVWVARSMAILCVIAAHTDFGKISNIYLTILIKRVASSGVPLFLIFSGYYFHTDKIENLLDYLRRKVKTVFLPWIFCGSLIYVYSALRGNEGLSLWKGIDFWRGYNSYLYYMMVLVILQICFYLIKKWDPNFILILSLLLNVFSLFATVTGITDNVLEILRCTNYLNIFNWIFFFAIGFWLQGKEENEILVFCKKTGIFALFVWCLLYISGVYVESGQYGYFSLLGFWMELCSSILIFRLAYFLRKSRFLVRVGKYSFSIYLLHIEVIPIVYKLIGASFVAPLITYGAMIIIICGISTAAKYFHCSKWSTLFLGIRN